MLLLRLRVRSWFLGWGLHPEVLRSTSRTLLWGYRLLLWIALFAWAFLEVLPRLQGHGVSTDVTVRVAIATVALLLLATIWLVVPALSYHRRARDATLVPEHLIGYCYRVAFDPPSPCYIRFGASAETARWYVVPPGWEEIISTAPPGTPFELWVLPATGWIERLRRGGPEPEQVTQPAPVLRGLVGDRNHAEEYIEPDADEHVEPPGDEGATNAEARAMKRYARRRGMIWLATPRQIFASWISFLVVALADCAVGAALVAWIALSPPRQMNPANERPYIILTLIAFGLIALVTLVPGIWPFAVWLRLRRMDDTQAEVTGEVTAWMPYRNWCSSPSLHQDQRREKLIRLRVADGGEQIFRLPPVLAYRIERRGEHVRITYRAETGQVLDVRHVEAPVEAVTAD